MKSLTGESLQSVSVVLIPARIFAFPVWQIGPRFKIERDMDVQCEGLQVEGSI
jgi:hypothetical protein